MKWAVGKRGNSFLLAFSLCLLGGCKYFDPGANFIDEKVVWKKIKKEAPELGLDPAWAAVWFGVLFVMNIQIYFLSPPFGPACFWLKSVAPPEIELQEIFMAVLPFIGLQIIGMMLVLFIPDIALWFPKMLSG